MVNCYWIKFEPNTKNYFFAPTITTNNILLLKICYKNVMKMLRIYHFSEEKKKKEDNKSHFRNTEYSFDKCASQTKFTYRYSIKADTI